MKINIKSLIIGTLSVVCFHGTERILRRFVEDSYNSIAEKFHLSVCQIYRSGNRQTPASPPPSYS